MHAVNFHPEADKEFNDSVVWYDNQRKNLGIRFITAVEAVIKKIEVSPEIYSYSRKPFREAPVPIFPFKIVFIFNEKNKSIYIASIFHTSRNPKKKYRKPE